MVQSTQGSDNLNSSGSAELLSTLEEKLRHSFASPTSLTRSPESNGASVLDNYPHFEVLTVPEMTEEDVETLDKARLSGHYIYDFTVQEFTDAILRGDYDVWKLRGVEGCLCIILTTYELYPHSRHLMVHYLAGHNCRPHMKEIKGAVREIQNKGNCVKTVYMAPNKSYARVIGGKQLAVFYEMTEEPDNEQPQEPNSH